MRKDLQDQIEVKRQMVKEKLRNIEPHPFGHAFLWGYVDTTLKNGKTKTYKACLGGVCAADLGEAVRIAESVPGVTRVWFNMD